MNQPIPRHLTQFLKNPALLFAACLYAFFVVNGAGLMLIQQNMNFLMQRWEVESDVISSVIFGNFIGRLLSYYVAGYLSDKFGRRKLLIGATFFYSVFILGILLSPNAEIAFFFAIIGGIGNACFDTAVYPLLTELYPKSSASAVVFCKAAVSIGQMLFPLLVGFLISYKLWFGYSFIFLVVLLILICIVFFSLKPLGASHKSDAVQQSLQKTENLAFKQKPKVVLDGVLLILYGCASFATFFGFMSWATQYAMKVAMMSEPSAQTVASYYGLGSFICVLISTYLFNQYLRPVLVMVFFPVISALSLFLLYFYPEHWVCNVVAFIVGFTAAGGLLQLGLSVLLQFFPAGKAKIVSFYMLFSSLASYGYNRLLGKVAVVGLNPETKVDTFSGFTYVMLCNAGVSVLTAVLGVVIFVRFYQIFSIKGHELRWGERCWLAKA